MKILILGSGGREHALAWKLSQSPLLEALWVAPGNAGTAGLAQNVALSPEDFPAVADFCTQQGVSHLLVGPEAPLVGGIVDYFQAQESLRSIFVLGPDRHAAQLEGSKDFAKAFMQKHGVPTAAYRSFGPEQLAEGQAFLASLPAPYVLKADGLAAGKGVLILADLAEAQAELAAMLAGKFGEASRKVVIEEFLDGREYSVFALTDGQDYKILPVAKDYKRIGEGDTGLNTGGMGAVSPVSFVDEKLWNKTLRQVVEPTIAGLKAEGFHYRGFVFFGLIEVGGEPKVIEYNVRLGDPETEVVLPRLTSDLAAHIQALAQGRLAGESFEEDPRYATTVMAVSEGYPGSYAKGKVIAGLENVAPALAFHAGTVEVEGQVLTAGGRVIALSAWGENQKAALAASYQAAKSICFEGIQYRSDIGYDL